MSETPEEGEIIEEGELLPARVDVQPMTLFGTDSPAEVVLKATETANALMAVVREKKLIVKKGKMEHPKVEAWTLLGSMLGVFPVVEWTHPINRDGVKGYEARVVAKTLNGAEVGAGEAECLANEENWKGKPDYALRSMAQTRATSKALAAPLRFIMVLAGFSGTPIEEMDGVQVVESPPVRRVPKREDLLQELYAFVNKMRGDPGWSEEAVVADAQKFWGSEDRPITTLNSLTVDELLQIKESAQKKGVW